MIIYLYIKQHSITGLKYFGKTTQKDPFKYPGSGLHWKRHYQKHGKQHIKTLEVWGFDDLDLCSEFAIKFSKENNIVVSSDWANLLEENGKDGLNPGTKLSDKTKLNMSLSRVGVLNHRYGKPGTMLGKTMSSESRLKISNARHGKFGKPHTEESIAKMTTKKIGSCWWSCDELQTSVQRKQEDLDLNYNWYRGRIYLKKR